MKEIKQIVIVIILFNSFSVFSQDDFDKYITDETKFKVNFYRMPVYNVKRPTQFLEQEFDFCFHKRFSAGAGIGKKSYPRLLVMPLHFDKYITGETKFKVSFYRMPVYNVERPTLFLEQEFDFRFHKRFSAGAGIGISLYPGLLAMPIYVHGKYYFNIKTTEFFIYQSIGTHARVAFNFLRGNRNIGSIGVNIKLKNKIYLTPEIGYNFLLDKYGGRALGFFGGIGINYRLKSF